jgi:long-chain acyl-CoA synthetase
VVASTEAVVLLADDVRATERRELYSGSSRPAVVALSELPFDGARACARGRPAAADLAEIVFTSGTTGSPKGVMLTHANVVANVRSARAALQPRADFRLLSLLPPSHMFEQTAGLYLPLHVGASVHFVTSRQPPVILNALRGHRVTAMTVVPQLLALLLEGIKSEVRRRGAEGQWRRANSVAGRLPFPLRRLLFRSVHRGLGGALELLVSGGAPLPDDLAAAWERLGVTVLEGYGATECAPSIATNTRTARRPGTVGRAVPGVEVRVSDDGELLVRGPNLSPGYWHDEEATRGAFTDDGWFRTGDVGAVDEDGFIRLGGRLNDVIVLASGLKVYPEDVEEELLREGAFADCAVVGTPGPGGAPRVHAVVVPADGGEGARERAAAGVRATNRRLAPHQRVAEFTSWENGELPRTGLRKLRRHEVLAALAGEPRAETAIAPPRAPAEDREARVLAVVGALADPPRAVDPGCDLALDLGLDSLARVELAVQLESELGISLEDGDLACASSVGDLLALVEPGGTAASPRATFPDWALAAPARLARAALQAVLLLPAHALVCTPFRVEGRDQLPPTDSPVLLVANHASHLDTPSILRALPRARRTRVAVAAAADYFFRTRTLRAATPLVLNGFPFSREGAVRSSLEHCGELVDRGWSVLVYPEGTRSLNGELQPFRAGGGLLATGLRVPVVPVAVEGSFALLPKGRRLPRRGPVTVRFGRPVQLDPFEDHTRAAQRLECEVAALLHFQHGT